MQYRKFNHSQMSAHVYPLKFPKTPESLQAIVMTAEEKHLDKIIFPLGSPFKVCHVSRT